MEIDEAFLSFWEDFALKSCEIAELNKETGGVIVEEERSPVTFSLLKYSW